MAKYSYEFKKKVVMAYLKGEGSYGYLSKVYDVPAKCNIEQWVHNYQKFGDDGLKRSRKNDVYTFEKKLSVVELYLSSEISYQDLALQEGITNPALISNWVKCFRVAGPDSLRPHKKGQKIALDKPVEDNLNTPVKETSVDISTEHVKELEKQQQANKRSLEILKNDISILKENAIKNHKFSDSKIIKIINDKYKEKIEKYKTRARNREEAIKVIKECLSVTSVHILKHYIRIYVCNI